MKYEDFLNNFNITKEHFNGLNRDDLLYAIYQQNFITFNVIEDLLDFYGVSKDDNFREIFNKCIYDVNHKIACVEMGCHFERYKESYKFNKNCKVSKIK